MTNKPFDPSAEGTDGARKFLVDYMRDQVGNGTFGEYIRTELAGDFAWTLANHIVNTTQARIAAEFPEGMPLELLQVLRKRRDLSETDASQDAAILAMPAHEKLQEIFGWEFGYADHANTALDWMRGVGFVVMTREEFNERLEDAHDAALIEERKDQPGVSVPVDIR